MQVNRCRKPLSYLIRSHALSRSFLPVSENNLGEHTYKTTMIIGLNTDPGPTSNLGTESAEFTCNS